MQGKEEREGKNMKTKITNLLQILKEFKLLEYKYQNKKNQKIEGFFIATKEGIDKQIAKLKNLEKK